MVGEHPGGAVADGLQGEARPVLDAVEALLLDRQEQLTIENATAEASP